MSTWKNLARWKEYTSEQSCPVCNQRPDERPSSEREISKLRVSRLIADRNTCMKGHCCMVANPHAVEIHDLTDADATAFIRDIQQTSRALQSVTGAIKINYEIHGNTIPHLHMHFWPRQIDDRFEDAPIDWRTKSQTTYSNGEFEAFVDAMQNAIQQLSEM